MILRALVLLIVSLNFIQLAWAESKPKFIVLAPHIVEMFYEIGAGEQIIGTTEHSDYPESAKAIPRIGNYANLQIERILQLKPDHIIAWKSGNPDEDLKRLARLGINLKYSNPNSIESVAQEILYFGELSGHQTQARIVADKYLAQYKQLVNKYKNKKPVKIFYQLWTSPLTTISNNAWPLQLIRTCQIDNLFDNLIGDYPHISKEQIIVGKPEIIIIPTSNSEPNGSVTDWNRYTSIPAVQNKQVLTVNSDKLHRMTPRAIDELAVTCELIEKYRISTQ